MSSKLNQYLIFLMAFALLVANSALSFAQETDFETVEKVELTEVTDGTEKNLIEEEKIARDPFENKEKLEQNANFLSKIKQELNLSKTDYQQLLNSLADTKEKLEFVTEEQMSLQEQLANLDDQIEQTQKKLLAVTKEILEKENTIALLFEQIEIKEVALETQKNLLKDYIRLIYEEEDVYFEFGKDGYIDGLKLLLAEGSVGENLRELDYLALLNEAGIKIVGDIDRLFKELNGQRIELEKETLALWDLKGGLDKEKNQLEITKVSKEQFLKITKGQETIYRELLEQTQGQQEQLVADIKALSEAVSFIEAKIKEEGADFDPEKYKSLFNKTDQALYSFSIDNLGTEASDFIWPVMPDRGISAYFRDPSYVGVFGVQHQAIDIPEYQGSAVRAAADGVVYKAKDNGYGYNYIIIAHSGNLMTVYGHVSNILVKDGQLVSKGSIIALSGGMPGTLGAGYMTTGPHLHLEVHLNGLPVDPLNYLPLEVLKENQVERLPEKHKLRWQETITRLITEPLKR